MDGFMLVNLILPVCGLGRLGMEGRRTNAYLNKLFTKTQGLKATRHFFLPV